MSAMGDAGWAFIRYAPSVHPADARSSTLPEAHERHKSTGIGKMAEERNAMIGVPFATGAPSMDHPLHIRQGLLEDLDTLTPLFDAYRRFYGQEPAPERARAFLHERLVLRESVIFLAEVHAPDRAEPVGFMQLYPGFTSVAARRLWILNDLFVTPGARNRGVGRALLERAREHARATGACRVTLSTAADNMHAQGLYESFGFQRDTDIHYSLPLD
jgi:ribosomal protein S18 acetylase RimI-like enzyme